jgi:hypothetical protein
MMVGYTLTVGDIKSTLAEVRLDGSGVATNIELYAHEAPGKALAIIAACEKNKNTTI